MIPTDKIRELAAEFRNSFKHRSSHLSRGFIAGFNAALKHLAESGNEPWTIDDFRSPVPTIESFYELYLRAHARTSQHYAAKVAELKSHIEFLQSENRKRKGQFELNEQITEQQRGR